MTELPQSLFEDRGRRSRWTWLLLLPLLGIAFAIWREDLLSNSRTDYLLMLFGGLLCLALGASSAWWLTGKRWGRAVIPTTSAMMVAAALIYYAGAAATLSAVLLALTALGIGSCIDKSQPLSTSVRLLVGLAVIAGVVGWLVAFHVHDPRVYLLVVGVVALVRRTAIAREIRTMAAEWRDLGEAHPIWLTLAVAGTAVAALGLWLPSLNYDDNAAHLILPDQLLANGYYRLDVSSLIWALAPWSNNVLHGVAALLAGEEARASVNVLWLLLGITGAHRLAIALGADRFAGLAAAAVFASHPLTAYFGTTMQVDGAVAAVMLHFAALLVQEKDRIATPLTTGALLGLLAGLKTSNIVYVMLPLLWLAWNGLKNRQVGPLFAMIATAALVGGSSYFYATVITGNPVFPLFNAFFQSSYMPFENFHDQRWDTGVDWRSLWDITFDTTRFAEVYPGAAGIALLVVLPGLCMELLRPNGGRWVGLWLLVAGIMMFSQIQYLRYIFPAIAILTTLGVVGFSRYVNKHAFALVVALVVAVNAMLMPSTSWMARDNPWLKLMKEGVSAKAAIERSVIPERALLERLHASSPTACVLMSDPQSPFVAGFGGRAIAMAWYDPRLAEAHRWAELDPSGDRWRQLVQSIGVSHIVIRSQVDTPLIRALDALDFARLDFEGAAEVWASAVPEKRRCNPQFQQRRDQAHRLFHFGDQH